MSGNEDIILPLSAAQREIWFAEQQLSAGNRIYKVGEYLEISGPIDAVLFEMALRQVVGEIDSLHVRFVECSDGPRQVVEPTLAWPMRFVDVSEDTDPRSAAQAWMTADVARPMDLTGSPLFSYALVKLNDNLFFWYQGYHHIVIDGFSASLVARRLAEIYTALANGVTWSKKTFGSLHQLLNSDAEYRGSAQFVQDREYWTKRFADQPAPSTLVGRSSGILERFIHRTSYLSPAIVDRLKVAASGAGVRWSRIVIAAVALYVHRITGAQDMVVGLPVTARQDPVLKRIPGMVSNILPLRLTVRPTMSLSGLIAHVAEEVRAVLVHQRYRGEDLHRDLGLPARIGASFVPMINIRSFNYDLRFAEYRAVANNLSAGVVGDLSIDVWDRRDGLGSRIDFKAGLDVSTGEDLLSHLQRFLRLLKGITEADPNQSLDKVDVITVEERHRLLNTWNDTEAPIVQLCLPALFEAQVAATPDATAVVFEDTILSYAELNAEANLLAHWLISMGVERETAVGVLLGRSINFVVSILAIVKAGGIYVPLDVRYPLQRMHMIMAETGASMLLIDRTVRAHQLPENVQVIVVDTQLCPTGRDSVNPSIVCDPEQLAYVMYTSGSTGQPKGIAVTHHNVASLALDPCWRSGHQWVLLHSPPAFDASTYELWVPLLSGGRIVVTPTSELDIATLEHVVTRHKVTSLFLTTALFNLMAEQRPDCFAGVREVWTGGEKVTPPAIQRVLNACPETAVVHVYGLTETTTFATYNMMHPPCNAQETVPIGRPMANTQVYILDGGLQPVPIGVTAELYISGSGVTRGYLGQPGATAQRFIADPFEPSGARMYRTGDLARWNTDGQLVFMGRVDNQVKIRGFRIEPGEIETVFATYPGIAQAAVVVHREPERPADKRLVAYVVPDADVACRADVLQDFARHRLPEYMVPAAVMIVNALPLTPNGKLDRNALPAPHFEPAGAGRAPQTRHEQLLAELFAEVLGLTQIGVDDDFFALGGDSIIAIQLVSRARGAGLIITVRDVFERHTVSGLAQIAADLRKVVAEVSEAGIGEVVRTPAMCWLQERNGPVDRFYQSMLLQVPARLGAERVVTALDSVLNHHDALRSRLSKTAGDTASGRCVLEVAPRGAVTAKDLVRRVDVIDLDADGLRRMISAEVVAAAGRLAPALGLMVQLVWFDAGPTRPGRLLLMVHHLVVDGVSWRILVPDLVTAWTAVAAGHQPRLHPVGTSMRQWSQLLQAHAQDRARLDEMPLWTQILQAPNPLLTDRRLDPSRDLAGAAQRLTLTLPPEVTVPLVTSVPAAFHGGVNDILCTGLALAIGQWRRRHGRGDHSAVLIDVEGHGREEFSDGIDLSRTVGWFTSVFPVLLDPGALSWRELSTGGPAVGRAIKRIKEQLGALPNHGIGFGLLRYLNPYTSSQLAALAMPQICFNYLGRFHTSAVTGSRSSGDWVLAQEAVVLGGGSDPSMPVAHGLEINALVREHDNESGLYATWSWIPEMWSESDVRELAQQWFQALQALVNHGTRCGAGGHTPTDFRLAALSQAEIDQLEAAWRT